MTPMMLAFIICGLLVQLDEAIFGPQKCWKNNLGHCRVRCFDTERYILLCRNKMSCCIHIELLFDVTRQPPLPIKADKEDRFDYSYLEFYTGAAEPGLNDMVTYDPHETTKNSVDETVSSPTIFSDMGIVHVN
ncbi:beta-defensin 125 [Nycticebus coucang]|uniref:beta-defensin 125 n=1 Tax=Nycticebus coucang TaxID=9470 RepID=UPI00234C8112|nr:beta-defensin 125 [Nycticebus coucang]